MPNYFTARNDYAWQALRRLRASRDINGAGRVIAVDLAVLGFEIALGIEEPEALAEAMRVPGA